MSFPDRNVFGFFLQLFNVWLLYHNILQFIQNYIQMKASAEVCPSAVFIHKCSLLALGLLSYRVKYDDIGNFRNQELIDTCIVVTKRKRNFGTLSKQILFYRGQKMCMPSLSLHQHVLKLICFLPLIKHC